VFEQRVPVGRRASLNGFTLKSSTNNFDEFWICYRGANLSVNVDHEAGHDSDCECIMSLLGDDDDAAGAASSGAAAAGPASGAAAADAD
jgi:hypothetical protein